VLAIVVAHSSNRVIGRDGQLPWSLPSDLRRFRELTIGGTVVMGRRTFESLPVRHRPLRGRRNLVVSSDPYFSPPGVEVHASLEAALAACERRCFVIGGGSIYAQALPHTERVYATHVECDSVGDTFFPPLTEDDWGCVEEGRQLRENGHAFVFRTYDRTR
jgi:dihydrofolate reductase